MCLKYSRTRAPYRVDVRFSRKAYAVAYTRPVVPQVIFFSEGADEPTVSHPRLVVKAGADAHVTLTQSYLSQGGVCLANGFTRVEVGDRATVVRRYFAVSAETACFYPDIRLQM